MSDLVEKVARAIAEDDWEQAPEGRAGQRMMQNRDGTFRDINALSRDEYRDLSRAAIAAVAEWLDAWHKAEYLQSENHASPALREQLEANRG